MIPNQSIVPIVFYSDSKGAAGYVVTLYSLLINKLPSTNYDIYYLHSSDFSIEDKTKMIKVVESYSGSEIHFHDMGDIYVREVKGTYPPAAYYRIRIPTIIPSRYKRVISLDYDIIVRGDLSEMFRLDMQDKCLGGVSDYFNQFFIRSDFKNEFKINDFSEYINSGVLLWNLEKIRLKQNIQEHLDCLVARNFKFVDQDILNVVFRDEICLFPFKYNSQNEQKRKEFQSAHAQEWFGKANLKEACDNPVIYHYTATYKPWATSYLCFRFYHHSGVPYMKKRYDEWWFYALESPCRDLFLPLKIKQRLIIPIYYFMMLLERVIDALGMGSLLKRIFK